jgi:hypothetical protein
VRREVNEGLNVVEQWNSANDFIFFARRGDMASNRREDHEISMLALHLLQNCMVLPSSYVEGLAQWWRRPAKGRIPDTAGPVGRIMGVRHRTGRIARFVVRRGNMAGVN